VKTKQAGNGGKGKTMKLEEIKNKTQEATDYLVHSLEAGHSEVLTEYLGAMAKFHTYSFGNIMLMARQNASLFRSTLCCSLNNLSDFRWPPKYLRSRERHANRGLKAWVQKQAQKAPQPRQNSAVSPSTTLEMRMFRKHGENRG